MITPNNKYLAIGYILKRTIQDGKRFSFTVRPFKELKETGYAVNIQEQTEINANNDVILQFKPISCSNLILASRINGVPHEDELKWDSEKKNLFEEGYDFGIEKVRDKYALYIDNFPLAEIKLRKDINDAKYITYSQDGTFEILMMDAKSNKLWPVVPVCPFQNHQNPKK